jgi:hypothetical protein
MLDRHSLPDHAAGRKACSRCLWITRPDGT